MIAFSNSTLILIVLGLVVLYVIYLISYRGERLLKCPSCQKRGGFKRVLEPHESAYHEKQAQQKVDVLDDVKTNPNNSMICKHCGFEVEL